MSPSAHSSAFVGFGQSRVFRHDEVPLGELAVEASRAAIADAGLDVSRIDGVICTPDAPFSLAHEATDGTEYVSTEYVIKALGIDAKYHANVSGTIGNSMVDAVRAVDAGRCDYALLFRGLHSSGSGSYGHTHEEEVGGPRQFSAPYGFFVAGASLPWTRYQDKYKNGSREQMATYITQERHNGLMYEGGYWAQYQPTELTVDDYLNARMVATPASIFDCDLPVQGAGAFIITTAERARDLPHPPAYVRGVSLTSYQVPAGLIYSNSNGLGRPLEDQVAHGKDMAKSLWADSGLGPSDVDVANLYDGFSIITMCWLESLGFCGEGEAFDFIQGGRIAHDGELPVNPSGGNLGGGRLHGINHLMDAVLQVTDRSGPRQIPNAEIALAAIAPASPFAGTILLGREPQ